MVAVGQGGRRLLSRDGKTWTDEVQDATGDGDPGKHLLAAASAGGLVVAVGGGCAGTSCTGRIVTFDGQRWTEATLPRGTSSLNAVAHGAGVWVAGGAAGSLLVSSDGKRWTAKSSLPAAVRALAFGMVGSTPMFVAVGDDSLRARSTDGERWTRASAGIPGADGPVSLRAVAIGNGVAIAGGALGRRIRSTDGLAWTNPAAGGEDIHSIVEADGEFLAYAGKVVHLSSNDGRTWSTQVLVNAPGHSVAAGTLAGARLFVGASGAVTQTSGNGVVWSVSPAGVSGNRLAAFAFTGY